MARITHDDYEGGTEGAGGNIIDTIALNGEEQVQLPSSDFVQNAEILRDGQDLVLEAPDGSVIVIEGYFNAEPAPMLVSPEGITLTPGLVNSFAQHIGPTQYADAGSMTDETPVGAVQEVSGEATVTRTDGSTETITIGTPIYQGDVVETDGEGAVNIVFVDESSFAISENAKLAIDEFVFDPASESGKTNVSMLRGVFVFTSGLIGRDDPDDVEIDTPMGSIGIRGTIIAFNTTTGQVTVIEGAIVLRSFQGETLTLADKFDTGQFEPATGKVVYLGKTSTHEFFTVYDPVKTVAPDLFNNLSDGEGDGDQQQQQQQNNAQGQQGDDQNQDGQQNAADGQNQQDGDNQGDDQQSDDQQQNLASNTNDGEQQQEGGEGQGDGTNPDATTDGEQQQQQTQDGTQQQTQDGTQQQTQDGTQSTSTTTTTTSGTTSGSYTDTSFDGGNDSGFGTSTGTSGSGTGTTSGSTTGTTSGSTGGTTGGTTGGSTGGSTSGSTTQTTTNDTTQTQPPPTNTGGTTNPPPQVNDFAPIFQNGGATFNIAESSAANTAIGPINVTDGDGNPLTYSIVSGDPGGIFSIDTSGNLLVSGTLDFESTTTYNLTVRASDGTYATNANYTVNVTDVNEAPTVSNATFGLNENSARGTAVGSVSASDPETAPGSLIYSIVGGDPTGMFAIDGTGNITIANDAPFTVEVVASVDSNAGAAPMLEILVDGAPVSAAAITAQTGSSTDTLVFSINYAGATPSNVSFRFDSGSGDGPETVSLHSVKINNESINIGSDLSSPILTQGASSNLNMGNTGTLFDSGRLDYEMQGQYNLTVQASDGTNSSTGTVTVNVGNLDDENPGLSIAGNPTLTNVTEDDADPAGNTVADIVIDGSITDPDGAVAEAIAVTGTNDANGTWEYSLDSGSTWNDLSALGTSGTNALLLGPTDMIRFVPNADYSGTVTGGLSFKAWDQSTGTAGNTSVNTLVGTAFSNVTETADITVTAQNDAPTLDLDDDDSTTAGTDYATSFTEDGGSVSVVDTDLTILDTDDANMESATVSLTNNQDGASEYLFMSAGNISTALSTYGITVTNSGTDTINLSGTATLAEYQAVLQMVQYENTSDAPDTTARTVDITVNDGDTNSNTATTTITMSATNDAPVLTPGSVSDMTDINEDDGSSSGDTIGSLVGGAITDADGAAFDGVAITSLDTANGIWEYRIGTGSWQATTALATSIDATNALLLGSADSIRFVPVGNYNGAVSFDFRAWDGTAGSAGSQADSTTNGGSTEFSSNTATINLTVLAVDDAPVLDLDTGAGGNGYATSYTEGNASQTIIDVVNIGNINLDDPDSTLVSVEVDLSTFPDGALEYLYIAAGDLTTAGTLNITVSFTNNNHTVTLTDAGGATNADFEAVLEMIKYINDDDSPTISGRTIDITADDGTTQTTESTTFTVTATDDDDTFSGSGTFSGDAGDDTITGSAGGDNISGGAGDDILSDNSDASGDNFFGDADNDTHIVYYNDGSDSFDGGTHTTFDTYDASGFTAGQAATVSIGTNAGSAMVNYNGHTDTVTNTEHFLTGAGDDTFIMTAASFDDSYAWLSAGAHTSGDTINYSAYAAGNWITVDATAGVVTVNSSTDTHTLNGFEIFVGTQGNDIFQVNGSQAGDFTYDGGTGTDTYDASSWGGSVNVDLTATTQQVQLGAIYDTISNFENFVGTGTNDTFISQADGNNYGFSGNAGADKVIFSDGLSGVTVDLNVGGAQSVGGGFGNHTLTAIEHVTGSAHDDNITGDAAGNILDGGSSVIDKFNSPTTDPAGLAWDGTNLWHVSGDTLYRLDANGVPDATYDISAITSTAEGLTWDGSNFWISDYDDTLFRVDNTGGLQGSIPAPVAAGSAGLAYDGTNLWVADNVIGYVYKVDPSDGTILPDNVEGYGANPTGLAWDGTYLWVAEELTDTIVAFDVTTGEIVDAIELPAGAAPSGLAWDGVNLVVSVDGTDEILIVSSSNDDVINGGGGADTIYGGSGNDTIDGEGGNDVIYGGAGKDYIYASSGNDTIDGDGAAGHYFVDTVDFSAGTGINVNLVSGVISDGGFGNTGTIANVEVIIGTSGADTIVIDKNAMHQEVRAGASSDTIRYENSVTFDSDMKTTDLRGGTGSTDVLEFWTSGGSHSFLIDLDTSEGDMITEIEFFDFRNASSDDDITIHLRSEMMSGNVGQQLTIQIDDSDDLTLDFGLLGGTWTETSGVNWYEYTDGTDTIRIEHNSGSSVGSNITLNNISLLGGGGGLSLNSLGINGFVINGTIDSSFGYALAAAGDINGDGYDDYVIGAASNNSGTSNVTTYSGESGPAHAVLGGAVPVPNANAGTTQTFIDANGDFDGDGINDLIISSPDDNGGIGYVQIRLSSGGDVTFNTGAGFSGNEHLGASISYIGDINGDGFDDVIVGAPDTDFGGADSGSAFIILGNNKGPTAININDIGTGNSAQVHQQSTSAGGAFGNDILHYNGNTIMAVVDGNGLTLYNLNNPTAPSIETLNFDVGATLTAAADVKLVHDHGSNQVWAFVVESGEMHIINVTNPSSIGATHNQNQGAGELHNAIAVDADFGSNIAVALSPDTNGGGSTGSLAVYDISSLGAITSYQLHEAAFLNATDVELAGEYAYVISPGNGIYVVDLTDLSGSGAVTVFNDTYNINQSELYAKDGMLFAAGNNTLVIYDITTDPTDPTPIGEVFLDSIGFNVTDIFVDGDTAVIISDEGADAAVFKVDISDPTDPIVTQVITGIPLDNVTSVAATHDFAYVLDDSGTNNLRAFELHEEVIQIDSPYAGDFLGQNVSSAGDFNDDGFADFMMSAPGGDVVALILGGRDAQLFDLADNSTFIEITGVTEPSNDITLFALQNLSGLGGSDIAIVDSDTVHIFESDLTAAVTDNYTLGSADYTISASGSYEILHAASAGDFDGDGYGDLVVAMRDTVSNTDIIEIFVVYGGALSADLDNSTPGAGLYDPTNAFMMTYQIPNAGTDHNVNDFNVRLSSAGDTNGDGFDDLLIGLPDLDVSLDGSNDDKDGQGIVVFGRDDQDVVTEVSEIIDDPTTHIGAPLAHWKMNDESGTTATNANGDNHGTMMGGLDAGNDSTQGISGLALQLDGTNDYITFTPDATLDLTSNTSFSISLWAKRDGSGVNDTLFGIGGASALTFGYTGNTLQLAFNGGVRVSDASAGVGSYADDGQWHNYTITYDGTNVRIYIDGQDMWSAAYSTPLGSLNGNIYIGSDTAGANTFGGAIDNVMMYGNALSAAQVELFSGHLTAGAASDNLVGTAGNDVLIDGGYDLVTFNAGAGDDVIALSDDQIDGINDFWSIDGGGGFDTIRIDNGAAVLDFSNVGNETLSGIEHIDMTVGGSQTVILGLDDLFRMMQDSPNDIAKIEGGATDIFVIEMPEFEDSVGILKDNNFATIENGEARLFNFNFGVDATDSAYQSFTFNGAGGGMELWISDAILSSGNVVLGSNIVTDNDSDDGDGTVDEVQATLDEQTLIGNNNANVLRDGTVYDDISMFGFAGNDTFMLSDATFDTINGGTGMDIMILEGNDFDLRTFGPDDISNIEQITIESFGGGNTLTMSLQNIQNLLSSIEGTTLSITSNSPANDSLVIDDFGAQSGVGVDENAIATLLGGATITNAVSALANGYFEYDMGGGKYLQIDYGLIDNDLVNIL